MTTQGMLDSRSVMIHYTNYKGETAWRHIVPVVILFTTTPHHPTKQWILNAYDMDKKASRDFAMCSIHKWMTLEEYKKQVLPNPLIDKELI